MNSRRRLSVVVKELWSLFYRIGLYGVACLGVITIMLLVLIGLVEVAGAHIAGPVGSF